MGEGRHQVVSPPPLLKILNVVTLRPQRMRKQLSEGLPTGMAAIFSQAWLALLQRVTSFSLALVGRLLAICTLVDGQLVLQLRVLLALRARLFHHFVGGCLLGEYDKNFVGGDSSGGASAASEARVLNCMEATSEPLVRKSKTQRKT